jgi:class 3 adenylate cyclase
VLSPETKYATNGDVSIAYQVVGDGPPDIVFVPGFVSHVELNWEAPFLGDALRRVARMGRLVSFDKRGMGLSDRKLGFGSLEERMDDIRAVLDAAEVERATFFAVSEGGPLAIMFAASHPERVDKLVLYGSFARVVSDDDDGVGVPPEVFENLLGFVETRWGSGRVLSAFVKGSPDEARATFARLERYTASPGGAVAVLRDYTAIDVRPLLESVRAPTLVVHATGDPMIPFACAEYLAEHIEGARLAPLDGAFHLSWDPQDQAAILDHVEEFVVGHVEPTDVHDRVLTTVLFTDIVDSTVMATRLGDAQWRALLDRHDVAVRRQLDAFRGREVNTTGDGFVATFDGPARAVRCAQEIARSATELGVHLRAGVHTGECVVRGDDIAGLAVHMAARVMSLAGSGQVFVTRTVRDLVVGSGIKLEPRGRHELKGLPEAIDVFEAVR